LSAAIELIETIDAQRVPAAKALKVGTAHRYAGSATARRDCGLIWVLRRRASSAWLMDATRARPRTRHARL
jgi:16S rRNA (cytosine967-C5)-methyltransferase